MAGSEQQDAPSGSRAYDGLKHWLQLLAGTLPPAEQKFCTAWAKARGESISLSTMIAGVVFHLASLVADPFLIAEAYVVVTLRWMHGFTLLACAVAATAQRKGRIPVAPIVAPSLFASLLIYLYSVHQALQAHVDMNVVFAHAWTYFVVLGVIHIILLPDYGWRGPVGLGLALFAASAALWYPTPYATLVLPIAFVSFLLAALVLMVKTIRALAAARLDFHRQTARALADAATLAREMELAQQIQDSLTSPAQIQFHGLRAACYSRRVSQIGGDWSAMRVIGNDLVVVVADAAGKGIQAALVIHAVQALWAGTLRDKTFDPRDWMVRVNQTLTQLGENKFHMVTLGLLRIDASGHAVYWSAGHLPVFLIERGEVRRIHGRGTPLGLSYDLTLQTAETDLGKGDLSILIGTDGAFNRGALQRNHDVIAIRDAVRDQGVGCLDALPADDDKTLIWIEQSSRTLPDIARSKWGA